MKKHIKISHETCKNASYWNVSGTTLSQADVNETQKMIISSTMDTSVTI